MVGIKPLGDRVAIKRVEAEEKTMGGLILTSSAKEALVLFVFHFFVLPNK